MSKKNTQVNLRFSSLQIELGKKKASALGMSFTSWVKYLIMKEIETLPEFIQISNANSRQMTTQEMIDANKKQIEELVRQARNEPIDPDTDLPY